MMARIDWKRWAGIGALGLGLLTGLRADATASTTTPLALRVMTFNLRYASNQTPNAWPDRRPVMRDVVQGVAPDVMGTQEGLYPQLRDLDADLPAYDWIGEGRAGGSEDEFCAIFYRRDRFEPVAYHHFWLSDTPETVGSMTWGNHYRRMATWLRLRERSSGREFIVLNTHFDHEVETARQKSAALIRDRLAAFPPDLPLLVIGDFNCAAQDSAAFTTLVTDTDLVDAWTAARTRAPVEPLNTFHGYEPPRHEGERIDWILARAPAAVISARIVTDHAANGQYPSDHFPVVAEVMFR